MKRDLEYIGAILVAFAVVMNGIADLQSDTAYEKRFDAIEEKQTILETKIESLINISFMQEKPRHEAITGELEEYTESFTEEPTWETFIATAYCPCEKCCGKWSKIAYKATASGVGAQEGRTIAMDESYPFGTRVYIDGMGEYVVEDRGSAIVGDRIDIYFETHEAACEFGMKEVRARIIE